MSHDYQKAQSSLLFLSEFFGEFADSEINSLKRLLEEKVTQSQKAIFKSVTDQFIVDNPTVKFTAEYTGNDQSVWSINIADLYIANFKVSRDEQSYRAFLEFISSEHRLASPNSPLDFEYKPEETTELPATVKTPVTIDSPPTAITPDGSVPVDDHSATSYPEIYVPEQRDEDRIANNKVLLANRRKQIEEQVKLKQSEDKKARVRPIIDGLDEIAPEIEAAFKTLNTLINMDEKNTLDYVKHVMRAEHRTLDPAYCDAVIEIELNNRSLRLEESIPFKASKPDPANDYISPISNMVPREIIVLMNLRYNKFIAEHSDVRKLTAEELLVTLIDYCIKNGSLDISRYADELVNLSNTVYNLFASKAFNVDAMMAIDVNNPYDAFQPTWFKSNPIVQLYLTQLRPYAERIDGMDIEMMTMLIDSRDQSMSLHRLDMVSSRQLNEIAIKTKADVVYTPDLVMVNASYNVGVGESSVKHMRLFFTKNAALSIIDKDGGIAQTFYTPDNCVSLFKSLSYVVYKIRKDKKGESK